MATIGMSGRMAGAAAALVAAALAGPVPAQQGAVREELVFGSAGELMPWCRQEAEARYVAKGITPYQWSSTYHDRSNVLYVNGKLRANGRDVEVGCRVARHARERYAVIEIDDPTL